MKDIEISDIKKVYPEFKFWKDIYTSINKSTDVMFISTEIENTLKVVFSTANEYYYLEGTVHGNTEFIKWLNSIKGITTCKMETLNQLRKTLKKECVSIKYNDVSFKYNFNDTGSVILFNNAGSGALDKIVNKGNSLRSRLTNIRELSEEDVKNQLREDIFEVFLDSNNQLSFEKTDNKLLEIPSAKIQSIQKAPDSKYKIMFSEKDSLLHRLVAVYSSSSESGLDFLQIFNTL